MCLLPADMKIYIKCHLPFPLSLLKSHFPLSNPWFQNIFTHGCAGLYNTSRPVDA